MKIKFVVDSTCDVPKELVEKYNIAVVPLTVQWMGETFRDGVDMTSDEFYDKLVKVDDHPKTSQPPVGEFYEVYKRALEEGYEKIISIHITSGFSGTCQSAETAAEMVERDKVEIIDSKSACMGAGWLVIKGIEAMEKGLDFSGIIAEIKKAIETTRVVIYLDTLEYAIRGGRISKLKGIVGSLLNVKPVIYFEDGMVKEYTKSRGKNKAIESFIDAFEKLFGVDQNKPIRIALAYGTDKEYAQEVLEKLKEKYNVQQGYIFQTGIAIAVHGGPNLLAACGTW
ncbi:EDD domain protein, DegV family [Anaerobranca californiensis DSM 14826]|uniref:EDD domain protein, DegV family n=1 Tax=Anaerobranca californiensis DSM 14826 TaxID=1120989 RepID=A0A1M6QMN7_9FIRM|nr:DegV family protein [Anaerobranca californiensis]SHK21435.1 EDD domain protein, DegV family [Anaerobranca californiensis DSM 14826]